MFFTLYFRVDLEIFLKIMKKILKKRCSLNSLIFWEQVYHKELSIEFSILELV